MENYLSLTKDWLEKIVIGLDLCPFAKNPWSLGLINIQVCLEKDEKKQREYFLEELESLHEMGSGQVSTSLVVYAHGDGDFLKFNDFVGDLESRLEEVGLDEIFQLVAFHPRFMFLGTAFHDKENLVNRSPFPLVHILRSEDLERARLAGVEGKDISLHNEKKLKDMSLGERERIFYYLKKEDL